MTLFEAYEEARRTPELVSEFNRLTGCALRAEGVGPRGLDAMIDDATGRAVEDERKFVDFFIWAIWLPLVVMKGDK